MAKRLYSECRLYNANARLISLDLADRIDGWIDAGMFQGLDTHCFLPYRDDTDTSSEEAIFLHDIQAIDDSVGIAGYFDGLTYDSGCAFEIGYGYSRGYKINLITTDMFHWSTGPGETFYPISFLANYIAKVVAPYEPDPNIAGYREQQVDLLERAIEAFRLDLVFEYGLPFYPQPPLEPLPVDYDYFVDSNFGFTEPGRMILVEIQNAIRAAGKNYIMVYGDDGFEIIRNLRRSRQAIFYSDVFEPNVDSGILQGIAYGIGRKPIVYCSQQQRYKSDITIDHLNCMIQYSADKVVRSLEELIALINE